MHKDSSRPELPDPLAADATQTDPAAIDPARRRTGGLLLAASLAPLLALGAGCTTPRPPVEPPPAPPAPPAVVPPPIAPPPPARAMRLGLALGGGAARGFAHIGVIKVLEAQGIQVDVVAGTSAGSLVGALYASGMNGFALQQAAMTMDEATLADWSITGRGMLRGEALQAFVNRLVANRPMEQFAKPFAAVAADFSTGAAVSFTRGNAGQAVRASSSIPGVFSPVRIGNADFVDGGLVSPVPALAARQLGADFVIAVDISALPRRGEVDGLAATLNQTIAIMGLGLKAAELRQHADVVIRPEIDQVSAADFNARNQVVLAGEIAATRLLPEIRRKMDEVRKAKNLR